MSVLKAGQSVDTPGCGVTSRIDAVNWENVAANLDKYGWALIPKILRPGECDYLAGLYSSEGGFRKRVVMARHGFGRGEYKYFSYPLPDIITELRRSFYPHLAPIANRWNQWMKIDLRYPGSHAAFIERCHAAGQKLPTPLLLQYGEGDYNCLHQDLYGEHVFPLQAVFLLSEPGVDFAGGELVLTEQRPRLQSRVEVIPLHKGDAVIFSVHTRPHKGTVGYYRVNMRHGVSRLHSGCRRTAGIIFHDAVS